MVDSAITPMSWFFYRFVHQEPFDLSTDRLLEGKTSPDKDPNSANQAIPTFLVTRYAQRLTLLLPDLRVHQVQWLSLFAYPLTGGFKPWSLIPLPFVRPLLRFQDAVAGTMGWLFGFRVLITIEKFPVVDGPSAAAGEAQCSPALV